MTGVLLVLDGWGHRGGPAADDQIAAADTPTLDRLTSAFPNTLVDASGEAVGLLPGTVGNSEIGHLVIGAGRPLPYDSLLVARAIESGALRDHAVLRAACQRAAATGRALHLVGLVSDGQIHAEVSHLRELLGIAAAHGVRTAWLHAITDGRDVPDRTAARYLARLAEYRAVTGLGQLASVSGRGYAMDKAGDLALTRRALLAIADGVGARARSAEEVLAAADRGDVWVPPTALTDESGAPLGPIGDGDVVLFTNFRSDRIQQLADALVTHVSGRGVTVLSLARYDTGAAIPQLVARSEAGGGLADELERRGLRSVRIAEPEKFEHVTYYLNGRDQRPRAVEEHVRVGVGNQDVAAQPAMHLDEVVKAVAEAARRPEIALVVANLANIDVVGHTGNADATRRATEATDRAVAALCEEAAATGRWVLLVGDHGNGEQMTTPGPDGAPIPYGGHTANPVPLVLVPAPGPDAPVVLRGGGTLADVAPTVLALLGCPPGERMTGRSLL